MHLQNGLLMRLAPGKHSVAVAPQYQVWEPSSQLKLRILQIEECNICGLHVVPSLGAAVRCVYCLERSVHYACAFVTVAPWACARCTASSRSTHGILDDIQARCCPLGAGSALSSATWVLPYNSVRFSGKSLTLHGLRMLEMQSMVAWQCAQAYMQKRASGLLQCVVRL